MMHEFGKLPLGIDPGAGIWRLSKCLLDDKGEVVTAYSWAYEWYFIGGIWKTEQAMVGTVKWWWKLRH